jgi:hypothetical protein
MIKKHKMQKESSITLDKQNQSNPLLISPLVKYQRNLFHLPLAKALL